jgi:CheY-like chemotaxis protein
MKILYIDDDRINLVLFAHVCSMVPGAQLHTAADGDEALMQARLHAPDLLVIDLHLPGTDGYALLGQLRQQAAGRDAPAFLCTADGTAEVRQRALAHGFQDTWCKPVDVATVMQASSMFRARHAGGAQP